MRLRLYDRLRMFASMKEKCLNGILRIIHVYCDFRSCAHYHMSGFTRSEELNRDILRVIHL
jgi:hypothetical protein